MKVTKKILSIILIISLLFVVLQTSVFATNTDDYLNGLIKNMTTEEIGNATNTNNTNNVGGNNTNTTNTTNATNTANTNNASSNETLPKTGITEDYAIIAFAVICGVSAIYAYRKVKNYNIK